MQRISIALSTLMSHARTVYAYRLRVRLKSPKPTDRQITKLSIRQCSSSGLPQRK